MSKQNKGLVPELRFPEFRSSETWKALTLSELSTRITQKVGTKKLTTVSITAGVGFVSQVEKFSRDISGKQYQNYIHLCKGEYSYNKGNSKTFPQGCIYKLQEFDEAAVPNAFISFRFKKNYVGDFFRGYFDSNYHGRQLTRFITSGARSDGLLNISPDDFFSIVFPTPLSRREQQKIADCLATIDELITLHSQKLDALKAHKKGLMQQLFPAEGETVPKLRFPAFRGKGDWVDVTLSDLCAMQAGKFVKASEIFECRKEGLFPCYGGNGLRGFTKTHTHEGAYSLIGRQGALCGNVTLVRNKFHATEHAVVVSPKEGVRTDWLHFVLTHLELNRYATGLAQPGLSVENLNKVELRFTPNENEQLKIASLLSTSQELIDFQILNIEQLKAHKKGLMQKLFPIMDEVV